MNQNNEMIFPYLEMSSGFLLGMAVGYALKKSFKLLLLIFGLGLIFLFMLESQNIVSTNDQNLHTAIGTMSDNLQSILSYLKDRIKQSSPTSSGSTLVGFLAGIKFG